MAIDQGPLPAVPWFSARKFARFLQGEVQDLQAERETLRGQLKDTGGLSILELEARRSKLEVAIAKQESQLREDQLTAAGVAEALDLQLRDLRKALVVTEDLALLQEAGVYEYRHHSPTWSPTKRR